MNLYERLFHPGFRRQRTQLTKHISRHGNGVLHRGGSSSIRVKWSILVMAAPSKNGDLQALILSAFRVERNAPP